LRDFDHVFTFNLERGKPTAKRPIVSRFTLSFLVQFFGHCIG